MREPWVLPVGGAVVSMSTPGCAENTCVGRASRLS